MRYGHRVYVGYYINLSCACIPHEKETAILLESNFECQVYCNQLQCVAVCCSVSQCVAVSCIAVAT